MTTEIFTPFANELLKWNASINLIQEKTVPAIYERHILDSLQLKNYLDYEKDIIVDIGAGAGFPGMILTIDGARNVHLVEPTNKRAVFLNHIKNLYKLPVTVHACRWQKAIIPNATVVTSRAFASLTNLLEAMTNVSRETPEVRGLFLKGEKIKEEISQAQQHWNFEHELFQSSTHETGYIIRVWNVNKK